MATVEALILTPKEVGNIRAYVRLKFANLPQERHAEIVADAMRRIVMKQLPDYDEAYKAQLTDLLIRTAILEQRRPLSSADLLQACMQPDWRQPERLHPLHRWVERRMNREVPLDSFVAGVCKHLQQDADGVTGQPGPAHLLWEWLENISTAPSSDTADPAHDVPAAAAAEVIPLFPKGRSRVKSVMYGLLSVALLGSVTLYGLHAAGKSGGKPADPRQAKRLAVTETTPVVRMANALPPELQYREVNRERLVAYLNSRDSLLAEAAYMDAILAEAESHNINPLLLFAITGQEQGFVPSTSERSRTIANNPFNVYHSWEEFNTSIRHSAAIASNTIVNLSKDRPADADPIQWINRKYAEDPLWHVGVSRILQSLTQAVETDPEAGRAK